MSIDNLNTNQQILNKQEKTLELNAVKSFNFELEMPEETSFKQLIQQEGLENLSMSDLSQLKQEDSGNLSLLKCLKKQALKDNVMLKNKNIKDIRLLIYTNDMLNSNDRHKIDLDSLNDNDIKFLKHVANNPELFINSINPQSSQMVLSPASQGDQTSYVSFNVSKGLSSLIEYAQKTNKPVRLDFEGNSSLILRIDNQGKLAAEFMSSNKAMEYLLKNSIPNLRSKLDSEGIPYKEIVYKERNKRQNSKEQERS